MLLTVWWYQGNFFENSFSATGNPTISTSGSFFFCPGLSMKSNIICLFLFGLDNPTINQLDKRKEVTVGHLQPTMDESFGSSDPHKKNDLRCHKNVFELERPVIRSLLGGGFKYFLFSPLFGEDEPILTSIFFRWVAQPPTRLDFGLGCWLIFGVGGPGDSPLHVSSQRVYPWKSMVGRQELRFFLGFGLFAGANCSF